MIQSNIFTIILSIILFILFFYSSKETFSSNQNIKQQLSQLIGVSSDRICNIKINPKNNTLNNTLNNKEKKKQTITFNVIDSPVKSLNELKEEINNLNKNLKYTIKDKVYTKIDAVFTR